MIELRWWCFCLIVNCRIRCTQTACWLFNIDDIFQIINIQSWLNISWVVILFLRLSSLAFLDKSLYFSKVFLISINVIQIGDWAWDIHKTSFAARLQILVWPYIGISEIGGHFHSVGVSSLFHILSLGTSEAKVTKEDTEAGESSLGKNIDWVTLERSHWPWQATATGPMAQESCSFIAFDTKNKISSFV